MSDSSSIRYALAANTVGFVPDLSLIEASAQVETLSDPFDPADVGSRYDIVAAYGSLPQGAQSPLVTHVALLLNPAASPLDEPALVDTLKRGLNLPAVIAALDIPGAAIETLEAAPPTVLRAELANAGWPDGFDLRLGSASVPGAFQLARSLADLGIHTNVVPMRDDEILAALTDRSIHLALVAWTSLEQRERWVAPVGEESLIELYALPISYLVRPGLEVTFSPNGWPLPVR